LKQTTPVQDSATSAGAKSDGTASGTASSNPVDHHVGPEAISLPGVRPTAGVSPDEGRETAAAPQENHEFDDQAEILTSALNEYSEVDQLAIMASRMADEPRKMVLEWANKNYTTDRLKKVKKQLANHFWCSMFLGFAEAIETCQTEIEKVPSTVKLWIDDWLETIDSRLVAAATREIAHRIVDKAWAALVVLTMAQIPLLSVLLRAGTLRSLRMLAVLMCPDTAKHPAVISHGVLPLERDGAQILSSDVIRGVTEAFSADVARTGFTGSIGGLQRAGR
jgi:hypothetical protein